MSDRILPIATQQANVNAFDIRDAYGPPNVFQKGYPNRVAEGGTGTQFPNSPVNGDHSNYPQAGDRKYPNRAAEVDKNHYPNRAADGDHSNYPQAGDKKHQNRAGHSDQTQYPNRAADGDKTHYPNRAADPNGLNQQGGSGAEVIKGYPTPKLDLVDGSMPYTGDGRAQQKLNSWVNASLDEGRDKPGILNEISKVLPRPISWALDKIT